jgi:hypothetical protein
VPIELPKLRLEWYNKKQHMSAEAPNKQAFSNIGYSNRLRKTKRDEFFEILKEIIPWNERVGLIKLHYFDGRRGVVDY